MSVEQGLDPQQITAVADQLAAQGDRLEQVQHSGTAMMGVLTHAWAGPDVEFFALSWDQARSHIESIDPGLQHGPWPPAGLGVMAWLGRGWSPRRRQLVA